MASKRKPSPEVLAVEQKAQAYLDATGTKGRPTDAPTTDDEKREFLKHLDEHAGTRGYQAGLLKELGIKNNDVTYWRKKFGMPTTKPRGSKKAAGGSKGRAAKKTASAASKPRSVSQGVTSGQPKLTVGDAVAAGMTPRELRQMARGLLALADALEG